MQVAVLHHINALDTGLQIYIEKKKHASKCWLYGIENLFVIFNAVDKS